MLVCSIFNLFVDHKVQVHIMDSFLHTGWNNCENIHYLAVELAQGDSVQIRAIPWTVTENDVVRIPFRMQCQEGK